MDNTHDNIAAVVKAALAATPSFHSLRREAGSTTSWSGLSEEEVRARLANLPWEVADVDSLPDGVASPGCTYLSAVCDGFEGACPLSEIPVENRGGLVVVKAAHQDKSGKTCYEIQSDQLPRIPVNTVKMILGPWGEVDAVYTWFPGRWSVKTPFVYSRGVNAFSEEHMVKLAG